EMLVMKAIETKRQRSFVGGVLLALLVMGICGVQVVQARNVTKSRVQLHHTWHVQVGYDAHQQAIQGTLFLPAQIWINVGDSVVWTANGGDIHTVTFLKPDQEVPPFTEAHDQI